MNFRHTVSILVERMRSDIRLAIITLYSLSALGLITPFAIYRLYEGNFVLGMSELAIIGLFLSLMLMAWVTNKTQLAADLTACAATAGTVALVILMDISYLWTFSTLVGNFLMARKWLAVVASIALVISIGLHPASFSLMSEQMSYLAVSTLVSLFSLIFASRVNLRHGELSDMLSRDALTGAFNRRALDHDLKAIARGPIELEHCLIIMDLDEFKPLNDNYGHDAGDRVLVELVRIVKSRTREKDRFYRYGGDEFVLLLPDTSPSGAHRAIENLRQALEHELAGPGGKVMVSMGLAQRQSGESPDPWLKRADDALLSAKRTGKNRVVTAS